MLQTPNEEHAFLENETGVGFKISANHLEKQGITAKNRVYNYTSHCCKFSHYV